MMTRLFLLLATTALLVPWGWGQPAHFDQLKSRAFEVPDSVHRVALEAYDEAWLNGEGGLVEWAYLLGLTDYLQGAFLSSNSWYEDALAHLAREKPNPEDSLKWSASLWNNIGINHEILHNYPLAREAMEQSRMFERQRGDEEGEWVTAINEGLLLSGMGQTEEAARMLQAAADFFARTGDRRNEGKAWVNLGLAESKGKHFESAHRALDRAIGLFESVGDTAEVFNALINQGECLMLEGKVGELAGVFGEMDRWRPERASVRQHYHEQILKARWAVFQNNVAAAEQMLDSANSLREGAGMLGTDVQGIAAMLEIAAARGTPQSAYDALLTELLDLESRTNELAAGYALQVVKLQERSHRLAAIASLKQELEFSEQLRRLMTVALALLLLLGASVAWVRMRARNRWVVFRMAKRNRERLSRSQKPTTGASLPKEQRGLYERLVSHLEQEQSHLDAGFSLIVLAAAIQANPRYVSDAIKQARGLSFSQFINELRIERAIEMLMDEANEHLSLDQIADACGFANLRTFYRNFERHVNTTPAAFR